jgi:HSP20 family protein
MNTLTRWEPFREMQTMRELMDRIFDEPLFEAPRLWSRQLEGFTPALDVAEDDAGYTVKVTIPGVEPEAVDVTLTDNVLTVKGETKAEKDMEQKNYRIRERRYGSFMRSIALPMPVEAEQVEATHEHGVLTLRLPKAEAVKPKRITVKTTVNGS